jgi:tetratricopeptide (TPR) repeat protein
MKTWLWSLLLLVCLGLSLPLQRWIDARRGSSAVVEDALYISSGKTLKRMSLGFDGLMADLYWLRTIQYFGRKAQQVKGVRNISDVSGWHLDLLEPLLNITTELDPHYLAAYRFGALFLPDIDPEGAVRFVERAIRENPNEWRLYQDLGYIYWKQGRFREASETYARGSGVPGAPTWMKTMSANMLAKGGDRETARAMFKQIYEHSDDDYSRQMSLTRLKSLRADDEIAFLNKLAADYRERRSACPESLGGLIRSLSPAVFEQMTKAGLRFDERKAPLDPDGFAYDYNAPTCMVTLAEKSTIVRWKF